MNESYNDGYKTGLKWKDNYRPGGPWAMHPSKYDSEEFKKRCQKTVDDNRDYLRGFDDAIKERGIKLK